MSSHNHTREAVQTDGSSEGLNMEERLTHRQEVFDEPRGLCKATIDDLPDDALLMIFDFYLNDNNPYEPHTTDKWHKLVHVCRRWLSVVFASPRRLDLRLLCRGDRSVRAMLDVWPALPLQIYDHYHWWRVRGKRLDNIIAALEHPDRVRYINIVDFPRAWETLAAAMQAPFPELTYLRLYSGLPSLSVVGGSAPRLRTLQLKNIPFPAVQNLILSAGDLVDLTLQRMPRSGYVSPESMVACLSSLKRLESLQLGFEPPQSRPDQPSPPPQARVVLPALAEFSFGGVSEYLEDFVARIDTPVLSQLYMSLDRDFVFDIPHLRQFIGRARQLKPSKAVRMSFDTWSTLLEIPPRGSTLRIRIAHDRTDWQSSSMAMVCGQFSPLFSLVERLDLVAGYFSFERRRVDGIESTLVLELFRPFTTIQGLYVSESLVPFVALVLQELIGERATEVLPNLRDLFLGGSVTPEPVQKAIQPFVDARRLADRPIAIRRWEGQGANL
ncbi:hypothetical protein BC826DRAFT_1106533 [Russula brevipes]|nr:hypothetical protein BC826DRAFT_1106533 [Russula brevipes]